MTTSAIDLEAYCRRIGYHHEHTPTLATLRELHLRHTATIPFENLTPWLGEDVRLDATTLQHKIVAAGRGGYCYEQNLLFLHMLEAMGFEVRGLAARVQWNAPPGTVRARTHMLLLVDVAGSRYIADVGFGGMTPTEPLRLETEVVQATSHEPFRLRWRDEAYALQAEVAGEWIELYSFDLQAQLLPDYELANWYVSRHPASHFVSDLVVARPADDGRHALHDNRYSFYPHDGAPRRHALTSMAELREALETVFGIRLPAHPGLKARLQVVIDNDKERV